MIATPSLLLALPVMGSRGQHRCKYRQWMGVLQLSKRNQGVVVIVGLTEPPALVIALSATETEGCVCVLVSVYY